MMGFKKNSNILLYLDRDETKRREAGRVRRTVPRVCDLKGRQVRKEMAVLEF